jgi:hypothetical protein
MKGMSKEKSRENIKGELSWSRTSPHRRIVLCPACSACAPTVSNSYQPAPTGTNRHQPITASELSPERLIFHAVALFTVGAHAGICWGTCRHLLGMSRDMPASVVHLVVHLNSLQL